MLLHSSIASSSSTASSIVHSRRPQLFSMGGKEHDQIFSMGGKERGQLFPALSSPSRLISGGDLRCDQYGNPLFPAGWECNQTGMRWDGDAVHQVDAVGCASPSRCSRQTVECASPSRCVQTAG